MVRRRPHPHDHLLTGVLTACLALAVQALGLTATRLVTAAARLLHTTLPVPGRLRPAGPPASR